MPEAGDATYRIDAMGLGVGDWDAGRGALIGRPAALPA